MRTLQRNKRTLYYALYQGMTDVTDDDGNYTGEHRATYSTPVEARMNISGGRGQAQIEMFGIDNPFTRTVVTDDLATPFKTDTIWWIDKIPGGSAIAGEAMAGYAVAGNNAAVAHDYRCTGISRTINQVVIALAEVDVSHANNNA